MSDFEKCKITRLSNYQLLVMNTLIIPLPSTEEIIIVTGFNCFTDEEEQITFDEQLMLDREAYYQASQY